MVRLPMIVLFPQMKGVDTGQTGLRKVALASMHVHHVIATTRLWERCD